MSCHEFFYMEHKEFANLITDYIIAVSKIAHEKVLSPNPTDPLSMVYGMGLVLLFICLFNFVGLGFELRTLYLQSRHSAT
jgi:hypothetical protein